MLTLISMHYVVSVAVYVLDECSLFYFEVTDIVSSFIISGRRFRRWSF